MSVAIKARRILLASSARTATTTSARQTDDVGQCCRLYLNISAASGTGGLKVQLRGYDRISGNAVALNTGGTAVTATGLYVYEFMANAQNAAGNIQETVGRYLPVQWDAQVVAGDASSYTYSLSCEVMPG